MPITRALLNQLRDLDLQEARIFLQWSRVMLAARQAGVDLPTQLAALVGTLEDEELRHLVEWFDKWLQAEITSQAAAELESRINGG